MINNEEFLPTPEFGSPEQGMECATYARFSDKKQRDSSIEDQVRVCRHYAKGIEGYIPDANIFPDRDVRGAVEHRPALDRLMELIKSGNATFSDLIIDDTSRLARDSALAPKLRKFFQFHNIRLHFVANGMKSGTSGFDLQHTFQGWADEQYSEQLAAKVTRGQVGRVLKGYSPSGRCYGYRNVTEEHPTKMGLWGRPDVVGVRQVIFQEEAEVLIWIYELYADGAGGYHYIVQQLNQRGILSPRRSQKDRVRGWNHCAVKHILENERYRGRVIFGRMKTVRHPDTHNVLHRKRPENEWTVYDDPSLQIIPDELWERVQARRILVREKAGCTKVGGMSRTKASRAYLFSGILKCGSCGGSMIMANGPTGSYHCNSARRKIGCNNKQKIHRESLERYLIGAIASTVRCDATFSHIKGLFMEELSAQLKRQQAMADRSASESGAMIAERKQLTLELENLAEEIACHGGSEILRSLSRRKQARLAVIASLLDEVSNPPSRVSEEDVDSFLRTAFDELADILLGDPIRSKQEVLKRIPSLTLTPILHGGAPAYEISGDLALFSGVEAVLLHRSVHSTMEQHNYSVSLDGIVLKLDSRGVVIAVVPMRPCEVEDEEVLPQAA